MATTTDLIQQLYVAYFNRPADVAGLAFWVDAYDNKGVSIDTISKNFNTAAEYTSVFAGKSADAIVNTVYQNLFGRTADSAGLNFWGPKIASGAISTADLVKAITAGALNADGTPNADGAIFNNKVAAAVAFTNEIGAAGNEAERIAYSNGGNALTIAKAYIASVTTDASLTTAVANVHATAQTTLPAPVVTTSTLTIGVDTVAGGAGDDVINATPGASNAATFTSLDNIDGGAGNNTLNIVNIGAFDLASAAGASVKNIQTVNMTGTATLKGDVSGWAGVNTLNVTEVGGNAAGSIKAATTTVVNLTDGGQATGNISVSGGSNVAVTTVGVSTGTVTAGSSTTAGTINATVSDVAPGSNTVTGGTITTNGGTTVNVKHNIVASTSTTAGAGLGAGTANGNTGGAITVNGGAATTSATVTQTAEVAAVGGVTAVTGVSAVSAQTENGVVTFSAAGLASGASLTIGGLTVTAAGGALTQANLETIFASLSAGATAGNAAGGATFSGTLTGFSTGAAASHAITFTSATANTNVADLTYTDSNALTSVVKTQGAAAVSAVTAVAAVAAVGGITAGQVIVNDKNAASTTVANTITTVTLDGFGAASQVNTNALTTLNLANSANGVTVTDASATPTATTLALNVNNLSGATVTDNTIKTVNITASGKDSAFVLNGSALTTVTVGGANAVDLSGSSAANVTSFTSTNTSGVTVALNQGSTGTFGAGSDVVTVAAGATKAIALGAGDDTAIVTTVGTGGSVDGGTGVNTLSITAAAAATASANNTFAQAVKNFQKLVLTSATTNTVDVAVLGGYNDISAAGATSLTLNNTASGATLTLTGAGTAYAVNQSNALAGTADVLNVKLTGSASANEGTLTAANVEIVNITTADTSAKPAGSVLDTFALAGNDVTTLKVSGTAALSLTAGSTAVTSFDASGLVVAGSGKAGTGVTWTSGALTTAATIKGSVNGGDNIDASASTKAVTITETAGTNTIKGSSTIASTLTGGTGADSIYGGAGKDIIVGGGGADVIRGGAGADTITVSGGKNTIVQAASGDSGLNTSNNIQTQELTSTFDVIKGLVAGDKIDLSAFAVGTGVGNSIKTADLVLAATNLAGVAGKVEFAAGTFDAVNGVFSFGAAGADTVVTYDHGSGVYESIVLVGYHAGSTTSAVNGIITLG